MGCFLDLSNGPFIAPSCGTAREAQNPVCVLYMGVCVCVFVVRLLSVQIHKVSRVTTALTAKSKMWLGM